MNSKHVSKLWIILPLLGLLAVLCIRWQTDNAEDTTIDPPVIQQEPTMSPDEEPIQPPESSTPEPLQDTLHLCPDDTFPPVTVGPTAYVSDYSGEIDTTLSAETLVEITCGTAKGMYKLHTFTGLAYTEPDVIVTLCSDITCGAMTTMMLEEL